MIRMLVGGKEFLVDLGATNAVLTAIDLDSPKLNGRTVSEGVRKVCIGIFTATLWCQWKLEKGGSITFRLWLGPDWCTPSFWAQIGLGLIG